MARAALTLLWAYIGPFVLGGLRFAHAPQCSTLPPILHSPSPPAVGPEVKERYLRHLSEHVKREKDPPGGPSDPGAAASPTSQQIADVKIAD